MPINDLISREAAIAAVRDAIVSSVSYEIMQRARDAIAALPADRRWEELRAWIVARQAKAESYRQWDDLWSMFDLVLDKMDRIAPPADGAENIGPQRATPASPAQLKAIANQAREIVEAAGDEARKTCEEIRESVERQLKQP